jgi:hypothetical protein
VTTLHHCFTFLLCLVDFQQKRFYDGENEMWHILVLNYKILTFVAEQPVSHVMP